MAIFDSLGHLFGQACHLGLGVALVLLVVMLKMFFFSHTLQAWAQVSSSTKPVEVDVLVQGVEMVHPQALFEQGLKAGNQANITLRNQPAGQMGIKAVKQLPRTILVPQPNGSLKELPEPRTDQFTTDLLLILDGRAQITDTGAVVDHSQLKIGTSIELEGFNYDLKASVIGLRIKE